MIRRKERSMPCAGRAQANTAQKTADDRTLPIVLKRLDEIASWKEGWHDGHGAAMDRVMLPAFKRFFEALVRSKLTLPYLYLTDIGHLRAEWSFPEHEASAIFLKGEDGFVLDVHVTYVGKNKGRSECAFNEFIGVEVNDPRTLESALVPFM